MFFGDVVKSESENCPIYEMKLSEIGEIIGKYWLEIPKHFSNVKLDKFIVMPNHLHGIIEICNDELFGNAEDVIIVGKNVGGVTGKNNPMGKRNLGEIVRWFKGRCTFEVNNIVDDSHFVWQSNYYDHVIRNEKALDEIRKYICDNPAKWDLDRNNVENLYM